MTTRTSQQQRAVQTRAPRVQSPCAPTPTSSARPTRRQAPTGPARPCPARLQPTPPTPAAARARSPLGETEIARAEHREAAGEPWLLPQPRHGRPTVIDLMHHRLKLAPGAVAAAGALHHHSENPARRRAARTGTPTHRGGRKENAPERSAARPETLRNTDQPTKLFRRPSASADHAPPAHLARSAQATSTRPKQGDSKTSLPKFATQNRRARARAVGSTPSRSRREGTATVADPPPQAASRTRVRVFPATGGAAVRAHARTRQPPILGSAAPTGHTCQPRPRYSGGAAAPGPPGFIRWEVEVHGTSQLVSEGAA